MNKLENAKCLEKLALTNGENIKNFYTVLDDFNSTLIIRPSITGSLDTLKYFTEKLKENRLLNLEHRGFEGKTALLFAASRGHPECVEYLIKQGADKKAADFFGENCLTLAASHADIKTLDIILKNGVDLEIRGYQNETALISSAYSNHHQNLDFLLKNGADVSAVDNYGDSVMHKLARVGSLEMLKLVIESGIDKNAKGFNKHTALAISGVEFQELK